MVLIEDESKKQFLTNLVEGLDDSQHDLNDLEENQQFLTDENEDELTEPDPVPLFDDFKSNNFGRPTKYDETMPRKLFEFYHKPRMRVVRERATAYGKTIIKTYEVPERFPTVEYFCSLQCIHRDTFYEWLKVHPELSDTYGACKSWAKDTLVQNALEGKWNYKVAVLIAQNYTELREIPNDSNLTEADGEGGVEVIPPRKKGYDISEIDKYCNEPIETTAQEVKDGEKESVQVSQETEDI